MANEAPYFVEILRPEVVVNHVKYDGDTLLVRGIDKVRLIALWDGKNDMSEDLDVRLIKHMVDLMRDTGGMIEQINPAKLTLETIDSSMETGKKMIAGKVSKMRTAKPKKARTKKKK